MHNGLGGAIELNASLTFARENEQRKRFSSAKARQAETKLAAIHESEEQTRRGVAERLLMRFGRHNQLALIKKRYIEAVVLERRDRRDMVTQAVRQRRDEVDMARQETIKVQEDKEDERYLSFQMRKLKRNSELATKRVQKARSMKPPASPQRRWSNTPDPSLLVYHLDPTVLPSYAGSTPSFSISSLAMADEGSLEIDTRSYPPQPRPKTPASSAAASPMVPPSRPRPATQPSSDLRAVMADMGVHPLLRSASPNIHPSGHHLHPHYHLSGRRTAPGASIRPKTVSISPHLLMYYHRPHPHEASSSIPPATATRPRRSPSPVHQPEDRLSLLSLIEPGHESYVFRDGTFSPSKQSLLLAGKDPRTSPRTPERPKHGRPIFRVVESPSAQTPMYGDADAACRVSGFQAEFSPHRPSVTEDGIPVLPFLGQRQSNRPIQKQIASLSTLSMVPQILPSDVFRVNTSPDSLASGSARTLDNNSNPKSPVSANTPGSRVVLTDRSDRSLGRQPSEAGSVLSVTLR